MIGFKKKKSKKVKRPKRALATVGVLLVASALLRIGGGASEAFALDGDPAMVGEAETPEVTQNSPMTEEKFSAAVAALLEREERVSRLELQINQRMYALRLSEETVDEKIKELIEAENRLRDTIALAQTASENDLAQLTEVYANMKPKQAAAVFEEMDPEFAAGFIGRMRSDAAAAVMAGMTPTAAYTISVILAGRNAEVPTE